MNNLTERKIEHNSSITSIYNKIQTGQEYWTLIISDVHFDSIYCNRDLFENHLQEATRRNARVYIFGDFYDAMQGRFDPRRSMDELRPEYRRNDYFDYVINDTIEWFRPYSHLLDVISDGNHETSILKNNGTDLIERLVYGLRTEFDNCEVVHGGYGGWIRYMFSMGNELQRGTQRSVKLKYYHGSGAEAPVTRGVIQTNRQAVYLPDANIIVNGHSHHAYYVPITRERIGNKGRLFFDIVHFIRVPGYMQSYNDGSHGWDVMKGGVPKPVGAFWIKYTCANRNINIQVIPEISNPEII